MTQYLIVKDGVVQVKLHSGKLVTTMSLEDACAKLVNASPSNPIIAQLQNDLNAARSREERLQADLQRLRNNSSGSIPTATAIEENTPEVQSILSNTFFRDICIRLGGHYLLSVCHRSTQAGMASAMQRLGHCLSGTDYRISEYSKAEFINYLKVLMENNVTPYGHTRRNLCYRRTDQEQHSASRSDIIARIQNDGLHMSLEDAEDMYEHLNQWIALL